MKFFGQSIHGIMDLNDDGIIDVTIGGIGGAALYWWVCVYPIIEVLCVKLTNQSFYHRDPNQRKAFTDDKWKR